MLATAVATVAIAGSALAVPGELTFEQCIGDDDSPNEGAACEPRAPGLLGDHSIATTPDGKHVYVASGGSGAGPNPDDAVVQFDVDPATGALTFVRCVEDEDENDEGADCADAPALDQASSVAVGPDGKTLYVTSFGSDPAAGAIARFDIDSVTGALTFAQCIEDDDDDDEGVKCADAPGLANAERVVPSPDGKNVYVASGNGDAIVRFDVDAGTGALTHVRCIEDEDTDDEGVACDDAPGLFNATGIAVNAAGTYVVVGADGGDAVIAFDRAPATGALTFDSCIEDEDSNFEGVKCADAPGLDGVQDLAIIGNSLYAAARMGDSVAHLTIGSLSFVECIEDEDTDDEGPGCRNEPALGGAESVAVSNDGRSLYVAADFNSTLATFDRDSATGALTFARCIDDLGADSEGAKCGPDSVGLTGAGEVAVSPDDEWVYTGSDADAAVLRFGREPFPLAAPPAGEPPGEPGRTCRGLERTLAGDGQDGVIVGTDGPDVIVAPPGSEVRGRGGDDTICILREETSRAQSAAERTLLRGGKGDDYLLGSSGRDVLRGGRGSDLLRGTTGADELRGARGRDVLRGGKGADELSGARGRDVLRGGKADDHLNGGSGRDLCDGGSGRNRISNCE